MNEPWMYMEMLTEEPQTEWLIVDTRATKNGTMECRYIAHSKEAAEKVCKALNLYERVQG